MDSKKIQVYTHMLFNNLVRKHHLIFIQCIKRCCFHPYTLYVYQFLDAYIIHFFFTFVDERPGNLSLAGLSLLK